MGTRQRSRSSSRNNDTNPDVPLRVSTFRSQDTDLTPAEAKTILLEIWRLTRDTRLIEIEYAHRGGVHADLQLTTHASQSEDQKLNPATAAAKSFINTVRKNHPLKLACSSSSEDLK